MSGDKITVSTDALETLGTIIGEKRDCDCDEPKQMDGVHSFDCPGVTKEESNG